MSIIFSKWNGPDGIKEYIEYKTRCKPFSGAGINIRKKEKTALLRSVDGTAYYSDDLSNIENIKYTLFGNIGNQTENEPRFNKPLLNKEEIENIYVYRVKKNKNNIQYIWYGKYIIISKETKIHKDINNDDRKIIILNLKKL